MHTGCAKECQVTLRRQHAAPQGSALELFLHCYQASQQKKYCVFLMVRASVIATAFLPAES